MFVQQLTVLQGMNNFLTQKITLQRSTVSLLFKIYSIVEVTFD